MTINNMRVKPLVWIGEENDCYVHNCDDGEFEFVWYELCVADELELPNYYSWYAQRVNNYQRVTVSSGRCSFEEAKAAAQADYERRIIAMLEPVSE